MVSIRKTSAQFLQKKARIFSFVALHFCAKKIDLWQSFANFISRKIALFRICVILFCKFSLKGFCHIVAMLKSELITCLKLSFVT